MKITADLRPTSDRTWVGPAQMIATKIVLEVEDNLARGADITAYAGHTPRIIGRAMLLTDDAGWRGTFPIEDLVWDVVIKRDGADLKVTLSVPETQFPPVGDPKEGGFW